MAEVTLKELVKEFRVPRDSLSNSCSDEHLRKMSMFLDWRATAPCLGLNEAEIAAIEFGSKKEEEKRLKTLQKWRAKFGFKATYKRIISVLLDLGRADHAGTICEFLTPETESEDEATSSSEEESSVKSARKRKRYKQQKSKHSKRKKKESEDEATSSSEEESSDSSVSPERNEVFQARHDVIAFSGSPGKLLIHKKAPIGGGSFGNVLEATLNGDPCAVKILHGVFLFSNLPSHVQREKLATFKVELQHLEGLRHPNIVSHLATYTEPEGQTPMLVMELMDENLGSFLERHRNVGIWLPMQMKLSHDVATGLEYLHSKRIIHRDLSSNNILLNRRHAKIADFGISRLIDPSRFDKILSTVAPGTKGYMPPEAWKYSGKYNEKFDIFALGVLVIQIITCLPPAPGDRADVSGRIVSEFERRLEHIHCIQSNNPLRQIALHCIRDDSAARPIAADVHSWLDAYPRSAKIDVQLRRGVTGTGPL